MPVPSSPNLDLLIKLQESVDRARADRKARTTRPVPAHINTVSGTFCTREGLRTPGGRCPDGCDHADHYANDGHPECADTDPKD